MKHPRDQRECPDPDCGKQFDHPYVKGDDYMCPHCEFHYAHWPEGDPDGCWADVEADFAWEDPDELLPEG